MHLIEIGGEFNFSRVCMCVICHRFEVAHNFGPYYVKTIHAFRYWHKFYFNRLFDAVQIKYRNAFYHIVK